MHFEVGGLLDGPLPPPMIFHAGVHAHCILPQCIRAGLCGQQNTVEVMVCDF